MKITLLLVLFLGVGLSAVQDGKITIQGVKYYIHYSFLDWFQAHLNCNSLGMKLIELSTLAEITRFHELLNQTNALGHVFWSAGTDLGEKGKFQWFNSGKHFAITMWAHNMVPSVNESCVRLYPSVPDFVWQAKNCYSKLYSICVEKQCN